MTKHTGNNNVRDTSNAHGSAGGKPGGLTPNQGDFFGDIHAIYEAVSKLYPGARSRLLEPYRDNPVDVLVATILSQATNDTLSGRAFSELKSCFPDWDSVIACDPCDVEAALACGGLQRQKTKKIRSALSKLKEDFGEITLAPLFDWPKQEVMEYLTSLPGVGPKTAACVVVFGLGKPAFPVDTHILRIARRLGLAGKKQSASSVQNMFEKLAPDEIKMPFHIMLIQHGREICSARKPACPLCPLKDMCRYFKTKIHPDSLQESGEGTSLSRGE
ncbi:MAG: endonuclease III domain-containing protein [Bacillota bacterium]|jgi:endonuclease-3|nr:endonuclease III [Candidatus Fermentithermobacillaceae bacterium]